MNSDTAWRITDGISSGCWTEKRKRKGNEDGSKGKIHVRDLHTRDVCILPCREEGKYYLYDCFPRPGQKGCAVNVRESDDLIWWSESSPVFEPAGGFLGAA